MLVAAYLLVGSLTPDRFQQGIRQRELPLSSWLGVRAYNPLPIKTRIKETLSCVCQIEPTRQEPVEQESGPEFGCSTT